MAESIVSDWLSDYSLLEPSEIRTFAAQHEHNHEVASALFTVLNERLKYPDLLHSICNQFFSFYRSNEPNLRKFTMQFLPTLIYIYLNSVAQGDKRSCRSVETLLISIYNIEICSDDGQPKTISFRMPILAQPSIYHEEKNLNASDLRRWEENSNKEVHWGPLHPVESVNAQNRIDVMTAIMFTYNQQLSLLQKSALSHLCRAASLLVNQGFSKLGHAHRTSYGTDPTNAIVPKPLPRIPVSSKFLLELLHAVYFAMFNDFASIAIQTVDDIYNRSCYELYPEVILVTNAIKNSLHANPSGQPSDGPMGLSVALTPATNTVTVSKSMITNASFRTKKLPDDIPIQGPKDDLAPNQLNSISEELETDASLGSRNTSARGSKDEKKMPKVAFSGFKKSKDKEKESKNNVLASINNTTSNNTVVIMNTNQKNGTSSISTDIAIVSKENSSTSQWIANKKEKFVNRGSLQQQSNSDFTDTIDRMGTTPILKRKISIDVVTGNGSVVLTELNQLPAFISSDDKSSSMVADSTRNSLDNNSDSMDSSPDVVSIGASQRPSIAIVDIMSHSNNMQVSQV